MNVGHASRRSGLPAKTIRYYEEIGLVRPARAANGYRDYGDADLERLSFLKRARSLGFSIDECRRLIALNDDASRPSREVKRIALAHIREIDVKIAELHAMRATLDGLARACPGDDGPDCAILEDMSGAKAPAASSRRKAVTNRAAA